MKGRPSGNRPKSVGGGRRSAALQGAAKKTAGAASAKARLEIAAAGLTLEGVHDAGGVR